MSMAVDRENQRSHQRCCKDVGMHCALLNGHAEQVVTLRNFSSRGLYFESTGALPPGSLVVLRTLSINDLGSSGGAADTPVYAMGEDDPDACMAFRSHVVARVQRCERLDGPEGPPRFGVGAEIQMWND